MVAGGGVGGGGETTGGGWTGGGALGGIDGEARMLHVVPAPCTHKRTSLPAGTVPVGSPQSCSVHDASSECEPPSARSL